MAVRQESLHKSAVLLRSLPTRQRARLLSRLEPPQAAAVTAEIGGLRDVDGIEQEAVVREFAGASAARFGKRRPARTTPFQFLHDLPTDALLGLIAGEHPQTIALVLSCLPPRQAAAVLAKLAAGQQLSAVCRIATMSETSPEVVQDVEQGLRQRLSGAANLPTGNRGL
ncbi:MAG: hypothetical protein NT049_00075, partial [Planctomycetota bacterium]|nr:hypothetical protein [Planctomycetota bacterium]